MKTSSDVLMLLREQSYEIELLHENTAEGKRLYIEGVFAEAELKNGNGRWYPQSIMETAVARYNQDFVSKRRALGELNHPDYPLPKLEEAAILIEKYQMIGSKVYGKALVMDTPKGNIVRGLVEGGFNMGVSTRGVGNLKESNGIKYVQPGFMLTATDCVDMPSGPNCYVNPILESMTKWMMVNGILVEVKDAVDQNSTDVSDMFVTLFSDFVKTL